MTTNKHVNGKTVLFVNSGGKKKRFTLETAKKLGYDIVLLNAQNDAQKLAKHFIESNTYNQSECVDRVHQFLSDHPKVKIDGAITFWEDDIILLARLCREFKWIGNTPTAAMHTRNKFRMRQRLEQTGLPVPNYHLVRTENDLKEAMNDVGFPAVIKPVAGSDSEFVVRIDDSDDATRVFKYLKTNCTPDFNPIFHYNSGQFLYEDYVPGIEVSIECVVQYGIPHVVGIVEKVPPEEPYFVEQGDIAPARLTDGARAKVVKIAEASLIALGVSDSLGHIEMKLSPDGSIKIIDIASRMGGDYLCSWVKSIWDIDLVETGLKIATGRMVDLEWAKYREPSCTLVGRYMIPKRSGVVSRQRGLKEAIKHYPMHEVYITKEVGDTVLVPPEGFENMGWVVGMGKTYREAESHVKTFMHDIDIETAPFRSISSVGKTERKRALSAARITRKQLVGSARIEKLRKIPKKERQKLHIGILGNMYNGNGSDAEQDLAAMARDVERALIKKHYNVTVFDMNESPLPFEKLRASEVDIVFNVCERINDNALLEPCSAALLEMLQIPYTGSSPETLAFCMNKIRAKQLFEYYDIPTPNWDYVYDHDDEMEDDLHYPLMVKPADTHNSIGVTNDSVVTNKKELQRQIDYVLDEINRPALIEEYIEGDEYDVGILGNDNTLRALPLTRSTFEEMPDGYWHIYAYDAKWREGKSPYEKIKTECPARIPRKLASLITEISIDAYNITDCHDYARVEVRVDKDGNPFVLECNPNASICDEDSLPDAAVMTGMTYEDFIEEIIHLAIQRYKNSSPYYHKQIVSI